MRNLLFAFSFLFLLSCNEERKTLPKSTGSGNEIVLVISDAIWNKYPSKAIKEIFTEDVQTVPDGLAWDEDGNLYISCYIPSKIYKLDTKGNLELLVEDPEHTMLASPTNIAFCGNNRDILLSANLGRGHITEIMTGVVGSKLEYPII